MKEQSITTSTQALSQYIDCILKMDTNEELDTEYRKLQVIEKIVGITNIRVQETINKISSLNSLLNTTNYDRNSPLSESVATSSFSDSEQKQIKTKIFSLINGF